MSALIPKVYPLLADAVEAGVRYGYRRAFKYVDKPDEESIIQAVADAVLLEIMERFEIPENNG
jgi:hypothetical protein